MGTCTKDQPQTTSVLPAFQIIPSCQVAAQLANLHQLRPSYHREPSAFESPHRPSSTVLEHISLIHIATITMSAEGDQQVKLVSSDNVEIVTEAVLRKVLEWCAHHKNAPAPTQDDDADSRKR